VRGGALLAVVLVGGEYHLRLIARMWSTFPGNMNIITMPFIPNNFGKNVFQSRNYC
jgi:hypothetical protein